jgi:hypothetical protein
MWWRGFATHTAYQKNRKITLGSSTAKGNPDRAEDVARRL